MSASMAQPTMPGVIAMTRPAHEKEYRNPLSELRAIGYDDPTHHAACKTMKFINS